MQLPVWTWKQHQDLDQLCPKISRDTGFWCWGQRYYTFIRCACFSTQMSYEIVRSGHCSHTNAFQIEFLQSIQPWIYYTRTTHSQQDEGHFFQWQLGFRVQGSEICFFPQIDKPVSCYPCGEVLFSTPFKCFFFHLFGHGRKAPCIQGPLRTRG